MAFRTAFDGLDGLAESLEKDMAKAVTGGVRDGTEALKVDVREETFHAFSFSERLPKAWRASVFPRSGDSVDAVGWVAVKNTAANIIQSAIVATTIVAQGGRWLAVPLLQNSGRFGLKLGRAGFGVTSNTRGASERVTPAGWERRTGLKLRFVPDNGRRAFLVADAAQLTRGLVSPYRSKGRGSRLYGPAGQTFVVFLLVPQVRTRKRLDLDAVAERAGERTPGLIVNRWRD